MENSCKVLLYGFTPERLQEIESVLQGAGFSNTRALTFLDLEQSVGFLHGLEGYAPSPQKGLARECPVEFMMISGFSSDQLDALILAFRAKNMRRPPTSMLTEINKDWKLRDLIVEVCDEDRLLKGPR